MIFAGLLGDPGKLTNAMVQDWRIPGGDGIISPYGLGIEALVLCQTAGEKDVIDGLLPRLRLTTPRHGSQSDDVVHPEPYSRPIPPT